MVVCGQCGEAPPRAPGQYYCRRCQRARDRVSEKARRAELRRLRVEVKELRGLVERVKEIVVAVPDAEC